MTRYTIRFADNRIGANQNVPDLTVRISAPAGTSEHVDAVDQAVLKEVRRHVGRKDLDSEFLLDPGSGRGLGTVFLGDEIVASFRINFATEKVPA